MTQPWQETDRQTDVMSEVISAYRFQPDPQSMTCGWRASRPKCSACSGPAERRRLSVAQLVVITSGSTGGCNSSTTHTSWRSLSDLQVECWPSTNLSQCTFSFVFFVLRSLPQFRGKIHRRWCNAPPSVCVCVCDCTVLQHWCNLLLDFSRASDGTTTTTWEIYSEFLCERSEKSKYDQNHVAPNNLWS